MDVLTAERIMTFGPVPHDTLEHAGKYEVEDGLMKRFGHVGHWFKKLQALFPPSGQLKNMLNAALVCHAVPAGSKVAIIGSRYSVGSGDWVHLIGHWLSEQGKPLEIHCYDPNEEARVMQLPGVKIVTFAAAVDRSKMVHYHGIVDDVYAAGVGYTFNPELDAEYVSYKMYAAGKVGDKYYPTFLHETESRFFSFPMKWEEEKQGCTCQRCRIESFLNIERYADICEMSPCREILPELRVISNQWQAITKGEAITISDNLAERAAIVRSRIIESPIPKTTYPVDRIIGYGLAELPFTQQPRTLEQIAAPIVVKRPGTIVEQAAVRISRHPEQGFDLVSSEGEWQAYRRPVQTTCLPRGKAVIEWAGVIVERYIKYKRVEGDMIREVRGLKKVSQWCFLHRTEDACGLVTEHLGHVLCSCGHRHGHYDLSPFGVKCGTISLTDYSAFRTFLDYVGPVASKVDEMSQIVQMLDGDPVRMANYAAQYKLGRWQELMLPPYYYFLEDRWYYYPWEELRKVVKGPLSKEDFVVAVAKFKLPWPPKLLSDPTSPLRTKDGKIIIQ